MRLERTAKHPAVLAWWALGGLVALGVAIMTIRELPSMRREAKLMRM